MREQSSRHAHNFGWNKVTYTMSKTSRFLPLQMLVIIDKIANNWR